MDDRIVRNADLQAAKGTILPHVLCLLAQWFSLALPEFPGRRHITSSIVVLYAVLAHVNAPFTNDIGTAQPWSLMWVFWLATFERLLFCENGSPESSFHHIDASSLEAKNMASLGLRKLKWSAALIFNLRGVRWNWQVKNVPPPDNDSKKKFLVKQSLRFVQYLLISDLLLQLGIRLFWTAPNGVIGDMNSKYLTIRHPHLGWSFLNALVYGLGPYFFINMQYIFGSIVAVAVGLSKPSDWPPLMGKLRDVTTVRAFWGSFWHQWIRRSVSSISNYILKKLKIPRGTLISRYLQVWVAFAVSGFLHAQSMLMLPCPRNITFAERCSGTMTYFLWQAAAITIEDFAQWVWVQMGGKLTGNSQFRTIIGYVWVICSFWIALPWAADDMMRMRLTEMSFLPFSIAQPLMKAIPVPPRHWTA